MNSSFAIFFCVVLALTTGGRIWLNRRQAAHVRAHRERVPEDFASRITLASHQKAADYTCAKARVGVIHLLAETGLLLALTLGGVLQQLHQFWSLHCSGIVYGIALIFSVTALASLIDLPFSLYHQFVIEARFGFNRMTLALFLSDLVKQTLLGMAIGAPVIATVLWLMAAMGEWWWLYVWLFWCSFNLALLFIYPTWVAPLFNKFSPLEEGAMKKRIEALLHRCGFRASGLFVMDGSKRSSHGNAYFTGFGDTKRIVFFDTLLARLQPGEVEAVLAHELGHFRHRHVVKRIALMFGLSLGLLWLLGQLIEAPWFYAGLGIRNGNTALALILFFLVIPIFSFPFSPAMSLLSRRHEFEADAYAASHADAAKLVEALVKLYDDNAATLTPDPLHSLFYDSHPPASERISRLQTLEAGA